MFHSLQSIVVLSWRIFARENAAELDEFETLTLVLVS